MSPALSIIVPCYNLGQYLPEALDSILHQSFRDWECILVNDGSTDDTAAIAARYQAADARFIPLNLENCGVVRARNEGVKASSGKYLLFLDADDRLCPGYLERAVSVLDATPQATVVTGPARVFGEGIRPAPFEVPAFSMEMMLSRNCIHISSLLRRSDFDRAGGFRDDMHEGLEDWDFWLGILEEGGEVVWLEEPVLDYRMRKDSRNKGVPTPLLRSLRRKVWEHHKGLYARYYCDPVECTEYRRLNYSYRKLCRLPGVRLYHWVARLIHPSK